MMVFWSTSLIVRLDVQAFWRSKKTFPVLFFPKTFLTKSHQWNPQQLCRTKCRLLFFSGTKVCDSNDCWNCEPWTEHDQILAQKNEKSKNSFPEMFYIWNLSQTPLLYHQNIDTVARKLCCRLSVSRCWLVPPIRQKSKFISWAVLELLKNENIAISFSLFSLLQQIRS